MKKNKLFFTIHIIGLLLADSSSAQNNHEPDPQIFAPGIISTGDYETHPAFSPSGDTLYFLKSLPDGNLYAICVSYKKNNEWSSPEIVPFSGKYVDADPFVTKDGRSLYFVSNMHLHPGEHVKQDWDIWSTVITSSGRSEPFHLDSTINKKASKFFPTLANKGK